MVLPELLPSGCGSQARDRQHRQQTLSTATLVRRLRGDLLRCAAEGKVASAEAAKLGRQLADAQVSVPHRLCAKMCWGCGRCLQLWGLTAAQCVALLHHPPPPRAMHPTEQASCKHSQLGACTTGTLLLCCIGMCARVCTQCVGGGSVSELRHRCCADPYCPTLVRK